jgi:HAD superfamily phosphatase (TIGR01668 family)
MKNLIPDYEFEDVTKIDEKIFSGVELIIFDIDNTLFFPETTEIREDIREWFLVMNQKYKCVCFSNSPTISERKMSIIEKIKCELYISHNKKPSKHLFNDIVEKYNAKPEKVIVIGDFRMTDILFGKRSGAKTILVKPFGKEKKRIRIFRKIENLLLKLVQ